MLYPANKDHKYVHKCMCMSMKFVYAYGTAQGQLDTRGLSTHVSGDFYMHVRVLEGTPIKG